MWGCPICSPGICGYFCLDINRPNACSHWILCYYYHRIYFVSNNLGNSEDNRLKVFQVILCNPMVIQLQHYYSYWLAMNLRLMPWRWRAHLLSLNFLNATVKTTYVIQMWYSVLDVNIRIYYKFEKVLAFK